MERADGQLCLRQHYGGMAVGEGGAGGGGSDDGRPSCLYKGQNKSHTLF